MQPRQASVREQETRRKEIYERRPERAVALLLAELWQGNTRDIPRRRRMTRLYCVPVAVVSCGLIAETAANGELLPLVPWSRIMV